MQPAIRNFVLLFCGTLLFHLAGTWLLPLVDRDEPRFAEASREMIERHDYVVPFFNDRYRFDKPPLTYWAQVACYRLFGENAFAARFPSGLAAALVALVLFQWGARMRMGPAGFWAALFFTLSLQVFLHAKAAVADMWLVFFVALAHWAGWEMLRDRYGGTWRSAALRPNTRGWWWLFYLSLALAFLAKGPVGWLPLGTVAIYQRFRPVPGFARRFLFVRGMLLVLVLVALWGVPALLRTQGEFFNVGLGRHVVGRSFGTMQGHGSTSVLLALATLPYYFLTVFVSFAPWSVKLPWLVGRLRKRRTDLDVYLLAGCALTLFIFSIVKTKLPHYILPAFPLLALLLARNWRAFGAKTEQLRRWTLVTASVWLAIALIGFPIIARGFPATALFEKAEPYLQPEMDFAAYDFDAPSLVWMFRSQVHGFLYYNQEDGRDVSEIHPDQVPTFLQRPGPHFVVLPTKVADQLYPTLPNGYRKFSTRGFNFAKGRIVDLTLILKNT
ncbi:MAG: ArnT family glycosyltransferase [Chthoniobacterales bacterium]